MPRLLTPVLTILSCLSCLCCCLYQGIHFYDRQAMVDPVYMKDRRERQKADMAEAWDRSNAAVMSSPARIQHHGAYFTEM